MSNRRATLGAENTVIGVSGGTFGWVTLGWTVDGYLLFGNDRNEGYESDLLVLCPRLMSY